MKKSHSATSKTRVLRVVTSHKKSQSTIKQHDIIRMLSVGSWLFVVWGMISYGAWLGWKGSSQTFVIQQTALKADLEKILISALLIAVISMVSYLLINAIFHHFSDFPLIKLFKTTDQQYDNVKNGE